MHAGHDCDTVNKTKGILAYRKNYNERKAKVQEERTWTKDEEPQSKYDNLLKQYHKHHKSLQEEMAMGGKKCPHKKDEMPSYNVLTQFN